MRRTTFFSLYLCTTPINEWRQKSVAVLLRCWSELPAWPYLSRWRNRQKRLLNLYLIMMENKFMRCFHHQGWLFPISVAAFFLQLAACKISCFCHSSCQKYLFPDSTWSATYKIFYFYHSTGRKVLSSRILLSRFLCKISCRFSHQSTWTQRTLWSTEAVRQVQSIHDETTWLK